MTTGLFVQRTAPAQQSGAEARLPVLTVLKEHPKQVLLAAGSFIANNTAGYVFTAYLLSYGTTVLGLDRSLMLGLILAGAVAWLVVTPWASALLDRYGLRPVLLWSSTGLAAWMFVLFPLVDTAHPGLVLVGLLGTAVLLGATYGPMAALFCELFTTKVRCSGTSLGYQLGSILGGGLAPTLATALYAGANSSLPVTAYLVVVSLLGLACLAIATRTQTRR